MTAKIPRDKEEDYTREAAESRRQFLKEQANSDANHVGQFSFFRLFYLHFRPAFTLRSKMLRRWFNLFTNYIFPGQAHLMRTK